MLTYNKCLSLIMGLGVIMDDPHISKWAKTFIIRIMGRHMVSRADANLVAGICSGAMRHKPGVGAVLYTMIDECLLDDLPRADLTALKGSAKRIMEREIEQAS